MLARRASARSSEHFQLPSIPRIRIMARSLGLLSSCKPSLGIVIFFAIFADIFLAADAGFLTLTGSSGTASSLSGSSSIGSFISGLPTHRTISSRSACPNSRWRTPSLTTTTTSAQSTSLRSSGTGNSQPGSVGSTEIDDCYDASSSVTSSGSLMTGRYNSSSAARTTSVRIAGVIGGSRTSDMPGQSSTGTMEISSASSGSMISYISAQAIGMTGRSLSSDALGQSNSMPSSQIINSSPSGAGSLGMNENTTSSAILPGVAGSSGSQISITSHKSGSNLNSFTANNSISGITTPTINNGVQATPGPTYIPDNISSCSSPMYSSGTAFMCGPDYVASTSLKYNEFSYFKPSMTSSSTIAPFGWYVAQPGDHNNQNHAVVFPIIWGFVFPKFPQISGLIAIKFPPGFKLPTIKMPSCFLFLIGNCPKNKIPVPIQAPGLDLPNPDIPPPKIPYPPSPEDAPPDYDEEEKKEEEEEEEEEEEQSTISNEKESKTQDKSETSKSSEPKTSDPITSSQTIKGSMSSVPSTSSYVSSSYSSRASSTLISKVSQTTKGSTSSVSSTISYKSSSHSSRTSSTRSSSFSSRSCLWSSSESPSTYENAAACSIMATALDPQYASMTAVPAYAGSVFTVATMDLPPSTISTTVSGCSQPPSESVAAPAFFELQTQDYVPDDFLPVETTGIRPIDIPSISALLYNAAVGSSPISAPTSAESKSQSKITQSSAQNSGIAVHSPSTSTSVQVQPQSTTVEPQAHSSSPSLPIIPTTTAEPQPQSPSLVVQAQPTATLIGQNGKKTKSTLLITLSTFHVLYDLPHDKE